MSVLSRDEALSEVDRLSGPLGPPGDLDERYRQRDRWVAGLDVREAARVLVGLLLEPPADHELRFAGADDFAIGLAEILWTLGAHDVERYLEVIGPLLDRPSTRAQAIELIGELGSEAGLVWLDRLDEAGLNEAERRALAEARDEIRS